LTYEELILSLFFQLCAGFFVFFQRLIFPPRSDMPPALNSVANLPLERRLGCRGAALLNFTHHARRLRNTSAATSPAFACEQAI
jgi:hypothetical protein